MFLLLVYIDAPGVAAPGAFFIQKVLLGVLELLFE